VAEIPEQAVQAVAERMFRRYESEYSAGHLSWRDFADDARADLEAAAPLLAEAWGADEGATMAVEWGIRQNITPGHLWSYGFDEQRARKERPLIYGGGTLVRRTVTYGEWEEAP